MIKRAVFLTIILSLSSILLNSCKEEVDLPVAAFDFSPQTGNTNTAFTFNTSETTPGSVEGSYITTYYWDWNSDGVWDDTSSETTITHQFSSANTYNVTLRVRNNQGYTNIENITKTVTVTTDSNQDPSTPTLISPANGATDIALNIELNWTASDPEGDPLVFDVFLGTSASPELVQSNNTTTTYQTTGLEENTTYFWKITAKDSHGNSAHSVLRSFTTEGDGPGINLPPNKPTNPYPETLDENQPINRTLSWSCSDPNGDALKYKVYFGTSQEAPMSAFDLSATFYNPGLLLKSTKYYWRIEASDPDGETTVGETWQFTTGSNDISCPSSFIDPRNSRTYNTAQIGNQCWMAENLDIGAMVYSTTASDNQTNNSNTEKFCYNNNETNCENYGGLYQWNELMQYIHTEEPQGICPEGWHIPSETEWQTMVEYLGGNFVAGEKMKINGTSGFDALMGGGRNTSGSFSDLNLYGYFWSSSELNDEKAWQIHISNDLNGVFYNYQQKNVGNSIRCIKN
ncbi:MAG: FISUMP domain-containing protein [Bacteroidota bacterium]|nr:FISUMP domain-containing protein [Bacteroidota bacterium]